MFARVIKCQTVFILENGFQRLANVTVVASNVSFPLSTPPFGDVTGHQYFAQYIGVPPAGSTVNLTSTDGPINAQFVYVYLQRKGILALCEVEVFILSRLS